MTNAEKQLLQELVYGAMPMVDMDVEQYEAMEGLTERGYAHRVGRRLVLSDAGQRRLVRQRYGATAGMFEGCVMQVIGDRALWA